MFKITAIVSLMLIVPTPAGTGSRVGNAPGSDFVCEEPGIAGSGSTVWGTFSCDSCGNECVKACGTKHFRPCCFNYLRKKRGPEHIKFWTPSTELKMESPYKTKLPIIAIETVPDFFGELPKDFEPNPFEDMVDNRLMYEV